MAAGVGRVRARARWAAVLASIASIASTSLAAPSAAAADEASPAPKDEEMTPHPRAATGAPVEKPLPWSFSTPLAWPEETSRIDVAGYLLPQYEYLSSPTALPKNQHQYGARGSRVGFALHGAPLEGWSYLAHLVVIPVGSESVAILSSTSSQGVSIALPTGSGTSIDIEEATIAYRPIPWFRAKLGIVRIPFTVAQTTPIPKQMFPFRAPQSNSFQSGADTGLLTTFAPVGQRLQLNAGVFLGSSLEAVAANQTLRGPALAAQVSAHPLGPMSLREGDLGRGPLRVAVGFGAIYRRATLLDATGYEASSITDTRFAAWVRAQFRGAYLQAEYMRRLRTDDLTGRPGISEGAYVAASYFVPIAKVALGPLVRAGVVTTGKGFAPRTFTSFEGGLAFYPRAEGDEPEKLRFLVEYLEASVDPIVERQREALVQMQLEF